MPIFDLIQSTIPHYSTLSPGWSWKAKTRIQLQRIRKQPTHHLVKVSSLRPNSYSLSLLNHHWRVSIVFLFLSFKQSDLDSVSLEGWTLLAAQDQRAQSQTNLHFNRQLNRLRLEQRTLNLGFQDQEQPKRVVVDQIVQTRVKLEVVTKQCQV